VRKVAQNLVMGLTVGFGLFNHLFGALMPIDFDKFS